MNQIINGIEGFSTVMMIMHVLITLILDIIADTGDRVE